MSITKIKIWNPRLLILFLLAFTLSCKKYLNEKPDKSLSVGNSIADIQALLDYSDIMNGSYSVGEASADNYYLSLSSWNGMAEDYRNMYIWKSIYINTTLSNGWSSAYSAIYYANTAIEKMNDLEGRGSAAWNNVFGSALFYRAINFFKVALLWSEVYDSTNANTKMGIPLRLNSNFNEKTTRSTLEQTFEQILSDAKTSINYLPELPNHVMRPSKNASYALLSKVYLYMGDYNLANNYADSSLAINHTLVDYNQLNITQTYPMTQFNKEVIFELGGTVTPISNTRAVIDTNLYSQYSDNDLRKSLFFKKATDGTNRFYGSYEGASKLFTGLSVDELYFTKAECLARLGDLSNALLNLNTLLQMRYKTGTFTPYSTQNMQQALALILMERRKELVMRDSRWMDIKRLNREGAVISIKRILEQTNYELAPNEKGFALPIPTYVIEQSGIEQNP